MHVHIVQSVDLATVLHAWLKFVNLGKIAGLVAADISQRTTDSLSIASDVD